MERLCTVVLLPEPEGEFTVEVPALPGCFSRGRSINEALRNGEEAIRCHLGSMLRHGEEVPPEGDAVLLSTDDLTEALVFRLTISLAEAEVA
jgi:predicted RNase H-like HicB family nuclease